jgi:hypothetical protein
LTSTNVNNTLPSNSVFIGYDARPKADIETNQIVIGYLARGLGSNTAVLGNSSIVTTRLQGNVGIGTDTPSEALSVVGKIDLNDGGNSVFVGTDAGLNDDGSSNYNVGVGFQALRANTTGSFNAANGYQALYSNTTGYENTANGFYSLRTNTTGVHNTANGSQALRANTTGSYNTANGWLALYSNTTGNINTANGYGALYNNTTGSYNTANGSLALYFNTTGNYNVAIGYQAGRYTSIPGNNTLPSNSIFIGYDSRPQLDSQSNQIVIGDQAIGNGSNSITIGNSSHNATYIEGIYDATTNNSSNVYITSDGQLKRSLTSSVSVFDSLYSVGDSIIFITPNDTFYVSFEVQTDDWGNQLVESDSTLDGNGTTGSILKLAKQGATDGQVLKWNDPLMTWKPSDDDMETI